MQSRGRALKHNPRNPSQRKRKLGQRQQTHNLARQSGFIAPVSQFVSGSGFKARFRAVSVLAKWPSFKFGFKVCFSIGIFPNTDDVLFQTGFRGVSMPTRPVSESSCPERGSTLVSNVVSKYGFRFSFRARFQGRSVK